MPENLFESLVKNLDMSGYSPVEPAPAPSVTGANESIPLGRNPFMRCPLPSLWQPSPDAVRDMYLSGKIPQFRIFTPSPQSPGGSSVVNESVFISGAASSSSSSSVPNYISELTSSQVVLVTPILIPGGQFTKSVQMATSFQLLSVVASAICRIEIYGTASAQSQDIARAIDVPPPAGTLQNLISDVALDTVPYQWFYQNRIGANADHPQTPTIYITVTNIGTIAAAITLTLQYVPIEVP